MWLRKELRGMVVGGNPFLGGGSNMGRISNVSIEMFLCLNGLKLSNNNNKIFDLFRDKAKELDEMGY